LSQFDHFILRRKRSCEDALREILSRSVFKLASGDIIAYTNIHTFILGCEGFEKRRSMVLVEGIEKCTTNFHGKVLHSRDAKLWKRIFVRCVLAYLREHGVIGWI
jgi:hypothetical protein